MKVEAASGGGERGGDGVAMRGWLRRGTVQEVTLPISPKTVLVLSRHA